MADEREMIAIVREAVLGSFQRYLPDAEFAVADRSEGGPQAAVFADGGDGAVAWLVRGTDHREDETQPDYIWPGIGSPSGHPVTVKGVTFVSGADTGDPELFVVVDWADVLAQIGALVVDRPIELDNTPTT